MLLPSTKGHRLTHRNGSFTIYGVLILDQPGKFNGYFGADGTLTHVEHDPGHRDVTDDEDLRETFEFLGRQPATQSDRVFTKVIQWAES